MTNNEAERVIALVAAFFPSRLPKETVFAWAMEILPFDAVDGFAGVRRMARETQHPSLVDLLSAIKAERDERRRKELAEKTKETQLPAFANADPEQQLRTRISAALAREILEGRRPTSIDFAAEVRRRLEAVRRGDDVAGVEDPEPLRGDALAEFLEHLRSKKEMSPATKKKIEEADRRRDELKRQAEKLLRGEEESAK